MKYELTDKTTDGESILYRIRALRTIKGVVNKGELGGWVKSEECLDQNGSAWIYENAQISGNARIYGDAQISGNARISGSVRIYENTPDRAERDSR